MSDEYAELYAQGLNATIPFHELVLSMRRFNINLIPSDVGEQLNKDMTDKLISEVQ